MFLPLALCQQFLEEGGSEGGREEVREGGRDREKIHVVDTDRGKERGGKEGVRVEGRPTSALLIRSSGLDQELCLVSLL